MKQINASTKNTDRTTGKIRSYTQVPDDYTFPGLIGTVFCYGKKPTSISTPVDLSTSVLWWWSVPQSTGTQLWKYWDDSYNNGAGGWQTVSGETTNNNLSSTEKYTQTVEDLVGKPYVTGANGPDAFDCSGAVCYGIREVVPGFGDYSADQLFSFTESTISLDRGVLIFYDYTSDGNIDHVTTLTGDGDMVHPSSGSGFILRVSSSYLDSYISSHGGVKYYRKINWSMIIPEN
ncbi:MAG: hypothetical protein C0397_19620 [Odoribacter sp.]|nr:hypothetical protein [Odoribacter sp.]